jgi:putative ABC transport system substrate-binding protein
MTAAWPLGTQAQQPARTLRSGLRLGMVDAGTMSSALSAFLRRLSELGFVEGQNLSVDHEVSRIMKHLDEAYAEVVKRGVDVLLALGDERLLKSARRAADGRIPVVFVAMDYDPLQAGYVASLAKPAGNLTGLFVRQPDLAVKRLQITRDALPKARRVALVWDANVARDQYQASAAAAASLGFDLRGVEAGQVSFTVDHVIGQAVAQGAEAIVLASSIHYYNGRAGLAQAALEARLPLMAFARQFVEVGAMLSYGIDVDGVWRRAAEYVARIADGTHPSDLPVEQPTRYELVVNGKTAASLGLTLTPALLGRADEVID